MSDPIVTIVKTVAKVRERNASVTDGEIEAAIDEALAALRADMKAEISAKLLNKK